MLNYDSEQKHLETYWNEIPHIDPQNTWALNIADYLLWAAYLSLNPEVIYLTKPLAVFILAGSISRSKFYAQFSGHVYVLIFQFALVHPSGCARVVTLLDIPAAVVYTRSIAFFYLFCILFC